MSSGPQRGRAVNECHRIVLDLVQLDLRRGSGSTHHEAGHPDAPQLGVDVVPHADAAPPDPLAHRQLQEEERDADEDEEDEVGHQVRTW